jgi:hypothetical protein
MGEFLQALLPWKLRILTSHFELTNGATNFWVYFDSSANIVQLLSGLNNVFNFALHPITNLSFNIFTQFRLSFFYTVLLMRDFFFTKPAATSFALSML